jgi:SNF2 family DNA or RNA helicase
MTIPPPFKHQKKTTAFLLASEKVAVLNTSEAGTGKTRGTLDAIQARLRASPTRISALVLAPKSILEPAWAADARKFTPLLRTSVAYASNRAAAFTREADIYITNHDAVKWLAENTNLLRKQKVTLLIVDEGSAYKHHTSQRSKALRDLIKQLQPDLRTILTATPSANNLLDIWHLAYLLDDGARLGGSYYKFRQSVCVPQPIMGTPHANWIPKEGAEEAVAELLDDITISFTLAECLDVPKQSTHTVPFQLPAKVRQAYEDMRRLALLELSNQERVTAVNAAVLHNKLLQISSGAIYANDRKTYAIDDARAELVVEMCAQREQTLVAFLWTHQRDALIRQLKKRDLSYAVIDGSVSDNHRTEAAKKFQAGDIRVLLVHPRSAAHGLTLTRATTAIWASPTSDAELSIQFARRIYRAGQTKPTAVYSIIADDTVETATYERSVTRTANQQTLLDLLKQNL